MTRIYIVPYTCISIHTNKTRKVMKTEQKFNSKEAALEAVKKIVGKLPNEITPINTLGELLFEGRSPIDKGYVVVCGSVNILHDASNNKFWQLTKYQGM